MLILLLITVTKRKRINDKFPLSKLLVYHTLEEIQQSRTWWIIARVLVLVLVYLYW